MLHDTLSQAEIKTIRSVFNLPLATRNAISEYVRLSILKTSTLLNSLEEKGLLIKSGKTKSLSGRPSYIYDLSPSRYYSIGLTLKLDHFHAVIIDAQKQIIDDRIFRFGTGYPNPLDIDVIVEKMTEIINDLAESIPTDPKAHVTVGIGVPGMIDTEKKKWLLGLHVGGIRHFPLAETVQNLVNIPVYIEDNSRSVTYFEKLIGSCSDLNNFVVLYLGSGVGTGIVTNGELYRGTRGLAGELGHIVHLNNTYRCSCGNVGCLETVLTPHGIIRIFRDRLDEGVVSALSNTDKNDITLESILQAAVGGDQHTRNTLFEIGTFLGDACTMIIGLFNPQKIVITGKTVILKDYLSESTMQRINQNVLPEMREGIEISFNKYNQNLESLGVALFALDRHLKLLSSGI